MLLSLQLFPAHSEPRAAAPDVSYLRVQEQLTLTAQHLDLAANQDRSDTKLEWVQRLEQHATT